MKHSSLPLLFLLLATLACSAAQIGQGVAPSGNVLYRDGFDDPHSGWGEFNGDPGVAAYTDGAYHIYVKSPNVNLWAHPGKAFDTARLEADLMTAAGPQENRMGLICRLQGNGDFYYFVISADGYYGIGKVRDGQWSLLNAAAMQQHAAIHPGEQKNHLRADCIGDLLILYVNDQLVGSAKDSDLTGGDVGLLAGAFDTPGVDVYFDDFVVFKP